MLSRLRSARAALIVGAGRPVRLTGRLAVANRLYCSKSWTRPIEPAHSLLSVINSRSPLKSPAIGGAASKAWLTVCATPSRANSSLPRTVLPDPPEEGSNNRSRESSNSGRDTGVAFGAHHDHRGTRSPAGAQCDHCHQERDESSQTGLRDGSRCDQAGGNG